MSPPLSSLLERAILDEHAAQIEFPANLEALDQAEIANLSSMQISRMTRGELTRMVRASRLPVLRARPEYLDRDTLERLAHVGRLACRNRQQPTANKELARRE